MSIPGSASPLFFQTAAGAAAGFSLQKSVRFNSDDSAYLNRTPVIGGNRKIFTYSTWVKRSSLSDAVQYALFSAGTSSYNIFGIRSDGRVRLEGNAPSMDIHTLAKLRDASAWYHIVFAIDTTQSTASNRVKIYINGVQQDLGSSSYPAQNGEFSVNDNSAVHQIGRYSTSRYFDGYMASTVFIDGSQEDCTSFGEFDDNGVWRPIDVSGLTFGTNGFHLFDFANESGIGNDSSGNDNDFTVNNISSTAGAGNDVLRDVPTNGNSSDDTGAGGEVSGNYATFNALDCDNGTLSNGNLTTNQTNSSTSFGPQNTTIGVSSGKWYCEIKFDSGSYALVGITHAQSAGKAGTTWHRDADTYTWYFSGAFMSVAWPGTSTFPDGSNPTYTAGDVVGVLLDKDNDKLYFTKNGSYVASMNAVSGTNGIDISAHSGKTAFITCGNNASTATQLTLNAGQRPFASSAPSGYKALCTTNLPTPTIADGSDYFQTALWTGNATARSITTTEMSPDLVWIVSRSADGAHNLFDTIRGATKLFETQNADAETTNSGTLTSFNSDGFSLGTVSRVNGSSTTYVGWAWDAGSSTVSNTDGSVTSSVRANTTAGFSIVKYTGNGTNATIGHGLNAAPEFIFLKGNTVVNWVVFHTGVPNNKYLELSSTGGPYTNPDVWRSTDPTSSVFSIHSNFNASSTDYYAYCFAPVAGYSAMGSYSGNSSSDGPFIFTGFRVAWLLIRRSNGSANWFLVDSTRDPDNPVSLYLKPNQASAEIDTNNEGTKNFIDFLSNGFKLRGTEISTNASQDYIYIALAENPFQANGGLAF